METPPRYASGGRWFYSMVNGISSVSHMCRTVSFFPHVGDHHPQLRYLPVKFRSRYLARPSLWN